jgi:glycerate kinase
MDVLGGEIRRATVSDPLGRPVEARFALADGGRAGIVETAEASGVRLVAEGERDAFAASTRGTGELIAAAVEAGARSVVLAVGGSATTDGGAGALEALDEAGVDVPITVLCDVRTSWENAARVFGPQKGADPPTVARLEKRLDALASAAPRDPRGVPMTGCAGGLSGGLWAFRGAKLVPGAAYVLDAIGFDDAMREARFVITGEGRLDAQTLEGKACAEVATRARQGGVACHAVVGRNELDAFRARVLDFGRVIEAGDEAALEAAGRELAEI